MEGCIDQRWQMDMADMHSMQKFNDGYRYLLVCTNVSKQKCGDILLQRKP